MDFGKSLSLAILLAGLACRDGLAQDNHIPFFELQLQVPTQTVIARPPEERRILVPPQFRTETVEITTVEAHCPGDTLGPSTVDVEISPARIDLRAVPRPVGPAPLRQRLRESRRRADSDDRRPRLAEGLRTLRADRTAANRVERVRVPAQTRSFNVRRVVRRGPPCSRAQRIPARTVRVRRQVLVSEAREEIVTVPMTYQTAQTDGAEPWQGSGSDPEMISVEPVVSLEPDPGAPAAPVVEPLPAQPASTAPDEATCALANDFTDPTAAAQSGRFPWPPPRPTSTYVLERDAWYDLYDGIGTLGAMDWRLRAALEQLDFDESRRKYYPVPHGFALVTRLERIRDDGTIPDDPASRWSHDIYLIDPPSIEGWLRALLAGAQGRFRVFAIVVTSEDVLTAGGSPDQDTALGWLDAGVGALNAQRANCPFTPAHRVTVLVYEFEHIENRDPILVTSSPIRHVARPTEPVPREGPLVLPGIVR